MAQSALHSAPVKAMDGPHSFAGFPEEATQFLAALRRNNTKPWFDAHRHTYEAAIVQPALAFIAAMGGALQNVAPSVRPEPRIGGSLFRIHRDVRFAKDKRPYKTHVGMRLRDGDTARWPKCTGPLFYVEFDASHLRLGVGVKAFDRHTRDAYRSAVANGNEVKELRAALRHAGSHGHDVIGEMLTRTPAGYAEGADDDLLRRTGVFVRSEMPLPAQIHSAGFVKFCLREFRPYMPLFHSLRTIALSGTG